jgi:predicted N-acetyltransferase YhbS
MPEFAVRIATPQDEASVCALLEASYPALMSPSYDEAVLVNVLPLITKANPSLLSAGTYYLAETDDRVIVGCGGWTRERPGTGERVPGLAHIRHFATHPSWIGQGVGRGIYSLCEQEARTAGVHKFECYSSLNAEKFYVALGFTPVRRIKITMGQNISVPGVLMERSV